MNELDFFIELRGRGLLPLAPNKLFASRTHSTLTETRSPMQAHQTANALKPRISPAPQTASGGLATFEYCFNHFLGPWTIIIVMTSADYPGNYGDVQIDTTDPQVAVDTCAARAVAERSTTFILNNYAGSFTCTFGNTATSKSEECTSSDYALYTVNAG